MSKYQYIGESDVETAFLSTPRRKPFREDDLYTTRPHTSTRRYHPQATPTRQVPHTVVIHRPVAATVPTPKRVRQHWAVYVGTGMLLLSGMFLASTALFNWWAGLQEEWRYGRPRTVQVDAVVGHHDSSSHPSHFIVENLHKQVLVIELPGGDPTHTVVYTGPVLFGDDQELVPVTVTFEDVNGDGKPDLVLSIRGSKTVLINQDDKFRPAGPQDRMTI